MTRLETIADRQRKSRIRDLLFAAFVGLVASLAIASITSDVATMHVSSR